MKKATKSSQFRETGALLIPGYSGNIGALQSLPTLPSKIIPGIMTSWAYSIVVGQLATTNPSPDPQVTAQLESVRLYARAWLKSEFAVYARSALAVVSTINYSRTTIQGVLYDIQQLVEYQGPAKIQPFIRAENILQHRAGIRASLLGAGSQGVVYTPMSIGTNPMNIFSMQEFFSKFPNSEVLVRGIPEEYRMENFARTMAELVIVETNESKVVFPGEPYLALQAEYSQEPKFRNDFTDDNLVQFEKLISNNTGLELSRLRSPYVPTRKTKVKSSFVFVPVALPDELEETPPVDEVKDPTFAQLTDLPVVPKENHRWTKYGKTIHTDNGYLCYYDTPGGPPQYISLEQISTLYPERDLEPIPLLPGPPPPPLSRRPGPTPSKLSWNTKT